jgi:hypothetical protein
VAAKPGKIKIIYNGNEGHCGKNNDAKDPNRQATK